MISVNVLSFNNSQNDPKNLGFNEVLTNAWAITADTPDIYLHWVVKVALPAASYNAASCPNVWDYITSEMITFYFHVALYISCIFKVQLAFNVIIIDSNFSILSIIMELRFFIFKLFLTYICIKSISINYVTKYDIVV